MSVIDLENSDRLEEHYFRVTGLWQKMCEAHSRLYQLTCEEYSVLLDSDVDVLDTILLKKEKVLEHIGRLERGRQKIIEEINLALVSDFKIKRVSDLLRLMRTYEDEKKINHLEEFSTLLVDIIKSIQKQNKKNQIFINKALISLKNIKDGIMGEKTYDAYTPMGESGSVNVK